MQEPIFYVKYALIISLSVTAIVTMLRFCWTSRWTWRFPLKWMVILTYLIVLLQIALLSREPGSRTTTNLIPFSTFGTTNQSRAYEIENIIMFLPMGILLPILCKPLRKLRWIAPVMLLISIGIEVTQFITERGYMQTDDVIMNVLGGGIGFVIFLLIQKMFCKK